jgi:hypothetical protein
MLPVQRSHFWLGACALLGCAILLHLFSHRDKSNDGARVPGLSPVHEADRTVSGTDYHPNALALAAAGIDQELDPDQREQLLARIVEIIPPSDLSRALELLNEATGPNAEELRQRILRRWADLQPAEAAAWAMAMPDNQDRGAALVQVATAWANTDPDATAAWTRSLPQGEATTTSAVLACAYEAARLNPIVALTAAGQLPPSAQRDDALAHSVSQWAEGDPNQAYMWANNIPDPDLRQRLLATVLTSAAEQNGAIAAGLVATQLSPGDEQNRAAVAILQRWAQSSPEDAAAWVLQFPDAGLSAAGAENLGAIWADSDPVGATRWIGGLAEPSLREAALRGTSAVTPGADGAPGVGFQNQQAPTEPAIGRK